MFWSIFCQEAGQFLTEYKAVFIDNGYYLLMSQIF